MFVLPGSFTGARHVAKSRVPRKGAEKPEPEPEASIVDESVSLDRLQILKQPHFPPFQEGGALFKRTVFQSPLSLQDSKRGLVWAHVRCCFCKGFGKIGARDLRVNGPTQSTPLSRAKAYVGQLGQN